MIPYKLRLENFLSYRHGLEPLDFSGMHLVCLIGENGHGKSALLDAITWVLWGKARASSDDDLMHSGSNEMQVEYEFGLAGDRYNVIRKRFQSGRSKKSDLELAVWDEAGAAWQALTEPSIRATQAHINGVLRMDYETFVNSAFLKQGEADAFTSKSPGQRKDILATILNLSQYDAYADLAKLYAKKAEAEATALTLRIEELDQELARQPMYEQDLGGATLSESQVKLTLSEADLQLASLRLEVQALTSKQAVLYDLQKRIQDALQGHEDTAQQLQMQEARLLEIENLLDERQAIEQGYATLQSAREEEQLWAKRLQTRRPLEQEQRQLERQLNEAKAGLEQALALVRKSLSDAQARVQALPALQRKAVAVQHDIERLQNLGSLSQERRERLVALRTERAQVGVERGQVKAEGDTLRERLDVLKTEETSDCPVCKQPLGAEGHKHLESEYEVQLASLRDQFRQLQAREKDLDAEEATVRAVLKNDERELRVVESLRRQLAEVETAIKQSEEAGAAVTELQARADALENQLAGDYHPDVRRVLVALQAELETLSYDESAHLQARATLSDLSGVERKQHAVETALKQEEGLREQVERLKGRWQREEEQLVDDRTRLQALNDEVQALPSVQNDLQRLTQVAERARADWEAARDRMIRAQQQLQACEALQTTRLEQMAELTHGKQTSARYRHLQEAFGPKGVQAMIIEAALPELETEANRLLGRLSDGRMNIRLNTQRELKTGGKRETLDIIISDELGSRPYELYSGGEAFRADLALRIALSRLLARRAGAALQTLFIDEGFGTQDAQGRENLVEAIHMIKDEFSLVLVITHIDELKEQFPVRIQVLKEEGHGSRYFIS